MKLEELPEPIGKFILENAIGINTDTGTYYHYEDVCNLLILYKKQLALTGVVQAKPEVCEHPFEAVMSKCNGELNHCLKCGKHL
jgi:hypothetical protein